MRGLFLKCISLPDPNFSTENEKNDGYYLNPSSNFVLVLVMLSRFNFPRILLREDGDPSLTFPWTSWSSHGVSFRERVTFRGLIVDLRVPRFCEDNEDGEKRG